MTVPPLTILWTSFSFHCPVQEGSSSTEVAFCLQLWVGGLSPTHARENKQNHSRVRRSISRAYKHAPLSFQLFISRQLPCCYWQLGECWDPAGTTSWHLLSPLPCLVVMLVTQKLIHSAGLAEDAELMWRQRHGGCRSTAVHLPAHKTFPPKLQKIIHGWYSVADNSDKDLQK